MLSSFFKYTIALAIVLFSSYNCNSQTSTAIVNTSTHSLNPNSLSNNVKVIDTAFFMPQLNRMRRIWVYLPDGYSSSEEKYPVLYMQDGQNLFDNSTSFAGEWRVDETADSLIVNGSKKVIIIGIDNGGKNRISEYTPFPNSEYGGGQGNEYINFIVNTLKPFIDNKYRTLGDRDNTSIMGSSLGGLISYYGIMKYKKVFSKAVVMSPSFWFSKRIFFIPIYQNRYKVKILFIAGDSESKTMIPNIDIMMGKLVKMKYPKESYKLKVIENGEHNEQLWRSTFADAYKWIVD